MNLGHPNPEKGRKRPCPPKSHHCISTKLWFEKQNIRDSYFEVIYLKKYKVELNTQRSQWVPQNRSSFESGFTLQEGSILEYACSRGHKLRLLNWIRRILEIRILIILSVGLQEGWVKKAPTQRAQRPKSAQNAKSWLQGSRGVHRNPYCRGLWQNYYRDLHTPSGQLKMSDLVVRSTKVSMAKL